MMDYKTLSNQPRAFLALTGLTHPEFCDLLLAFDPSQVVAYFPGLIRANRPDPVMDGGP